ncbi:MAG TPA: threonine ammonia-lyase [Acidimicrobiia bacterium]|nr:threonine ammonia-lyase [Acidimicrobiia bacterium]
MNETANPGHRSSVTPSEVVAARERFAGRVAVTPLLFADSLSRISGRQVWIKAESLQRTGSFKVRGALNVISQLDGAPVVAASAGNHAQGVALAAAWSGSEATVFMPEIAPLPKINATRGYGARVELTGTNLADAVVAAREYADKTGAVFVHPYDDPCIVAGQGTMGMEILEQLPEVGTVVVPTGGGGLLAGTAVAIHAARPEVRMVGVEIDQAPTYIASRRAGRPVRVAEGRTMADGINVIVPADFVFDLIEAHVTDLVAVDDAQASSALTVILERSKLVAEPAGAVAVAALLAGLIPDAAPDPLVVVLSGGNIDPLLLRKVIRHGLQAAGRYATFRVWVPDQPGRLAEVLELIGGQGANVITVEHHREGFELPFGVVEIDISVETRDPDHAEEIRQSLQPYRP